jgi:hypothetical protein
MTVTSGVVINIHYCMGEVATVELGHNSQDSCGQCGMDNSGCCHDDVQVVKLCADQLSAKVNHELPQTVLSRHDAMDSRNKIRFPQNGLAPPKCILRPRVLIETYITGCFESERRLIVNRYLLFLHHSIHTS